MATQLPKLNLIYENTHTRCKQHKNLNTKTRNNKNQDTKKVQVGKDQEKAQSEKDSHSKTEVGKNKLTIRYLYHETYRKPNEQLFSQ